MIKKILESLEDPINPLLGPNRWILMKMGLLLPKSMLQKVIYIIIHEIVAVFVISQYIELYLIRSNLDLVLTNLKISMLSVICVVKANTFVIWQKHWKEIIAYITESDVFERQTRDSPKGLIIDKYTKYCKSVRYFYWVLVLTTGVTTIASPLLHYVSSPTYRESLRNGTEFFPHIFSSWMPLDKYHSPGCWVTVVWHFLVCFYGAGILAAYDSSVMVMMVFIGAKLDLLRERCRQMFGFDGTGISDEEAENLIRQLHFMHLQLIKHSRLLNSLLSPVMFIYMIICSLMLCASAYQFTSTNDTAQKLLMAEFLIFGVAQLFVFCWHSNDVLIKNQYLINGFYESQWWTANLTQRKSMHILAGQMRIEHRFTAGPFIDLTLATFIAFPASLCFAMTINKEQGQSLRTAGVDLTTSCHGQLYVALSRSIVKGAYSYYTLLRK